MSSITRRGDTYRGISVDGRGVFNGNSVGIPVTYAGECKDGNACGLGVATWLSGYKEYADYGPDGHYDGWYLWHNAYGGTGYRLDERGKHGKGSAFVSANGTCTFPAACCLLWFTCPILHAVCWMLQNARSLLLLVSCPCRSHSGMSSVATLQSDTAPSHTAAHRGGARN